MVRIFSVSMPRSGHHVAEMVLGRLFRQKFHYCEFYTIPGCCKVIPCARTNAAQEAGALVFMQKSHDHDLTDPISPLFDGFAVQVRDPIGRMLSNYELNISSGTRKHTNSYQRLWIGVEAYYTVQFIKKWCPASPERIILKYEQLLDDPVAYFETFFERFRLPREYFKSSTIVDVMQYSSGNRQPFQRRNITTSKFYDADNVAEFCRLVAPAARTLGYEVSDTTTGTAPVPQIRLIYEFKELFAQKEYQAALDKLDRCLAEPEPFIMASCWRGNVLAHLGRAEEAAAEYARVIEIEPWDPVAYVSYAVLALRHGEPARARKLIQSCLSAARDKARAAEHIVARLGDSDLAAPARDFLAKPAVSRAEVVSAFRLILGREPENEHVITAHQTVKSLDELRRILLTSDEFSNKYTAILARASNR